MRFNPVPALLLAVFVLAACSTRSPVADLPVITAGVADFRIELEYLNRDVLIERHGTNQYYKQNPFTDYPGWMPPKKIVVFDTVFSTVESTVQIEIKDIRLTIEGEGGRAQNVLYMQNLWRGYAEDDGRAWPKILRSTKDFMLPEEMEITPGNPMTGYLVFPYGYPKEGGRGMLTVTASTPNGDKGTVDIPIRFSEYGVQEDTGDEGNSGIFAQDSN